MPSLRQPTADLANLLANWAPNTKLAWLGQPYAESVLGRNLLALLAASGGSIHDGAKRQSSVFSKQALKGRSMYLV